ncbi:MAG TPA: hypothetical protein VIU15_31335, partial [Streptomyces sp.]
LLGGTVRLPLALAQEAGRELAALPGWADEPWLRYAKALVLEEDGRAQLGDQHVTYDAELGLVTT